MFPLFGNTVIKTLPFKYIELYLYVKNSYIYVCVYRTESEVSLAVCGIIADQRLIRALQLAPPPNHNDNIHNNRNNNNKYDQ